MIIAKPVYGTRSVLLLSEHRPLDEHKIKALEELQYPGIYIEDDLSDGIAIDEIVSEEVRFGAIEAFKEMSKESGGSRSQRTSIMYKNMEDIINEIVNSIFESDAAVVNVPLLRSYDEYTYRHSVDVGVLSVALGKAMGLDKEKLIDLGKAAFFHDMGKMFVPQSILNKPAKLTEREFEVMKDHSRHGHDFAAEVLNQKGMVCRAVLHHHERFNGTGYPDGQKGERIPIYSRIIAAADVFDAISSTRPYKVAQIATEGYEYILANSGIHFDPAVVEVFYRTIAPFPVGMTVKLSNGLHGVVVKNNPNFMSRPLVRVYQPFERKGFEYIDLAEGKSALDITIVEAE
ncbi:MAG: HD-GYP domain-containing protein [Defluviitaleaceae bacterium]|nr:HD-GYP domain-containing protein [Defluviitaleaceae bacterium]